MWHVSSRSSVATLRTAIHLLLTYKRLTNGQSFMTWGPIYKIFYDLAYDYRKFIVRSIYDSDLTCAEISLREYRKLIYDTIFDDITILYVNLTYEKLSIHCKLFSKLDVRRKLIVTLALS